jgi:hypothetical protein
MASVRTVKLPDGTTFTMSDWGKVVAPISGD